MNTKYIVGKPESVLDEILLLNPHQIPLISALGISQDEVTQVEHNWYEDEMFAYESTVTTEAPDTATELVVASTEPFRSLHVVRVGEELLLVTAVDSVSNKITVTRGYAGTTAATITANSKIEVQFVESKEGRDAIKGRSKPRVRKSNLTQIFTDTIEITGSAAASAMYSIDDKYEYEKQKKQVELALQLERAAINGVKYENGDVRQMEGIRSFIQSNVTNAAGAALTMDMINEELQKIYTAGGFKTGGMYEIVVPAKQKRVVGTFMENAKRVDQNDVKRVTVVNTLVTDFGEFNVSINDNMNADELFILDYNRLAIKSLKGRGFFHEYLGKKGDYTEGMVLGEYTLELKQEKAFARIKGLSA